VIYPDIGSKGVADINALLIRQLPVPGCEGVRLAGEGSNRAEIDDIARDFAGGKAVHVRANLLSIPTAQYTQVLNPSNLCGIADAPCAVNAPRHDSLQDRVHKKGVKQQSLLLAASLAPTMQMSIELPAGLIRCTVTVISV
jgi:hypothetical protein